MFGKDYKRFKIKDQAQSHNLNLIDTLQKNSLNFMIPVNFRELTNKVLCGEEINVDNEDIINDFANYIKAYCADLKCTEHDVIFDDKLYDKVYTLFDNVILKRKYQIT